MFHNNEVLAFLSSIAPKMRSSLLDSLFSLISVEKDAHIFSIPALMYFVNCLFGKKSIIFSTVLEDLEQK